MRTSSTSGTAREAQADTIAVALFEDDPAGEPTLAALLQSGEAKASFKHLALARDGATRLIGVGCGTRDAFTADRARTVAALVLGRANELGTRRLAWTAPVAGSAAPLVEGTLLAAYRFDAFRSETPVEAGVEELVVCGAGEEEVARATVVAGAVNRARDLQNAPANAATPSRLVERARELAAQHPSLSVEVLGRDELAAAGMGLFTAVAQGSYEEPALIALRHKPGEADPDGPLLALVGKAVTFDSGGLSLKPAGSMRDMKFDMSGGAAVLETMGAVAELGLPVPVLAVVGATENLPSGRSVKPGDIVTSKAGLTVEINNTDAEGRLVLADCLTWAVEHGAGRLVDIATLTGGVTVALGSTFAGLQSNDEALAAEVHAAAERSGEAVWRLPLHDDYRELVKGRYADLDNAPEGRKASSSVGATFLERFAGDTPWAHLDIAGVAWDQGRPWAAKAGNGWGVRLLVELVASQA